MKFKKTLISLAVSAMSLSVMTAPFLSSGNTFLPYKGITASAAYIKTVTQNGLTYKLYDSVKIDGNVKYNLAYVCGCTVDSGCVTIPEGIYVDNSYYKIYRINSEAFKNSKISAIDMHNAYSLTTIMSNAFYDCKDLTEVLLPPNLEAKTAIQNLFLTCSSLKSFGSVPCANFTMIDGVVYNKEATKLLVYPKGKTDSDFVMPAALEEIEGNLTFYGNKNIKNIIIPDGLTDEENVRLAGVFFKIMKSSGRYDITCNGEPVYTKDENNESEPVINPLLKDEFYEVFISFPKISNEYAKDYAAYVANTVLDEDDTDIAKAVKLHDWLCDHTEYDPVVADLLAKKLPYIGDVKNHCDESAFLHYEKAHDLYEHDGFYTVCDGYARAYKLLMNAAGISCENVEGDPVKEGDYGHAWSIIRLNDKDEDESNDRYYYVDVTWDAAGNYTNFMKSGKEGSGSHGTRFKNWRLYSYDAFDTLPEVTYDIPKFGDADHSGVIDIADYKRIKEIIADCGYDDNADVNADGTVDNTDADLLAKYLLLKRGDLRVNGVIDEADINTLKKSVELSLMGPAMDVNFDGIVDEEDVETLEKMINTKTQVVKGIDSSLLNDIIYHTAPEISYGDIDNSGNINNGDVLMIKGIISAENDGDNDRYTEDERIRADINRDGKVNSEDLNIVYDYLNSAGPENSLSFSCYLIESIMK